MNFQLAIQPQTEQRLKKILAHSQDMEVFAQNIIAHQISQLQKGILNLQLDLLDFEKKYQMSSESFYQKFSEGILEDNEDYMIWSGLYELYSENQRRLSELK